jgi:hypothetical protein
MAALTNKQILVVALLAALLVSEASAVITCEQVGSNLVSCLPYTTGRGKLTPGCCSTVHSLNSAASTSADRQAVCRCIKSLASTISALDLGAISSLPDKCGVSVPIPISPSTDWDKQVVITFLTLHACAVIHIIIYHLY